ncbi:hypothetical protein EV363DRAFT_1300044 [Boletus edulis]|nr:hypothetical protein EV363DRAFT_1300044 [Boletus edulis]
MIRSPELKFCINRALFEVPAEAEAEVEEDEKAVKEKGDKENSLSGAKAEVGQQDGEVVGEEGKESASGACVEHEDVQSDDVSQKLTTKTFGMPVGIGAIGQG